MKEGAETITHYSDALCVWAYISQVRIDELSEKYADDLQVEYRFMHIFGDVAEKMRTQWAERGGLKGYAAHVQEVAAGFEHLQISQRAWVDNTPTSSIPAHLALCGLQTFAPAQVERLLCDLRRAFFVDLFDISKTENILMIAAQADIDIDRLRQSLNNGSAHAAYATNLAAAQKTGVRASPTLSFNEDRQLLTGNVGYRVMEANVRELLRHPGDQQSWC